MKKFLLALAALSFSLSAFAAGDDDAFYGKIEKMPSAQNPTWVIGGKTFKADARTKVESHGGHKFDVGACVKVEGDIDQMCIRDSPTELRVKFFSCIVS